MVRESYLLDTNILLRLVQPDADHHSVVRQSVELLWERRSRLFYTSQNLAEFWNVCTRPKEKNGFGITIETTNAHASQIEANLFLAADSQATHWEWRKIVLENQVRGVQVHDARLVATMHVHHFTHLLTLNCGDFRRYLASPQSRRKTSSPAN